MFKKLLLFLFVFLLSTSAFSQNPTYVHEWHHLKHGVGISEDGMPCADSICIKTTFNSADSGGQKQGLNLHTQLPDAGASVSYDPNDWTNDLDEADEILQGDKSRYVGKQQPNVTINYLGNNNALLGSGKATYQGADTPSGIEKLNVQGAPTGVYTFQAQAQYRADKSINGYLDPSHPNYKAENTNNPVTALFEYGTNRRGFFHEIQSGGYSPKQITLPNEGDTSSPISLNFELNTGGPHAKYVDLGLNPGVIHSAGYDEELTKRIQSGNWGWDTHKVLGRIAQGNASIAEAYANQKMNDLEASKVVRGVSTFCVGAHCEERIEGALDCAAGGAVVAGSVAATVGSGGAATAGAVYVGARAADVAQAGCRQLYTGKETKTLAEAGLEKIGLDEDTSQIVAAVTSGNLKQIGQNVVEVAVVDPALNYASDQIGIDSSIVAFGVGVGEGVYSNKKNNRLDNKKNLNNFNIENTNIQKKQDVGISSDVSKNSIDSSSVGIAYNDLAKNTFDKKDFKDNKLLLPPAKTAKELRNTPGIAHTTKKLRYINEGEKWLKGKEGNAGKIPQQIADKMNNKKFNNFDEYRKSFWKEVSKDPVLKNQFSKGNLSLMENGLAPYAIETQQVGKRKKYELDHNHEIKDGGLVYDSSNIVIRTPLNHIKGK